MTDSSSSHNSTTILVQQHLTFSSFEDLSTQLQLTPANNEECKGAQILAYTPTKIINNDEQQQPIQMVGAVLKEIQCQSDMDHNNTTTDLVDTTEVDFTEIWTLLRTLHQPFTLHFSLVSSNQQQNHNSNTFTDLKAAARGRLSSWSSNINQNILISKAQNLKNHLKMEDIHHILSSASSSSPQRINHPPQDREVFHDDSGNGNSVGDDEKSISVDSSIDNSSFYESGSNSSLDEEEEGVGVYGIYLHTNSGHELVSSSNKIFNGSGRRSKRNSINNSSILQIKRLEFEGSSSPTKKYLSDGAVNTSVTYQWYRTYKNNNQSKCEDTTWEIISWATNPTFQPSAIDVGWHLKCVVSSKHTVYSVQDEDMQSPGTTHILASLEECVCDSVVFSDSSLFNASRQRLLGGAKFNGFKLNDREVCITIDIGKTETYPHHHHSSSDMVSLTHIYQVVGKTAESLCGDKPIVNAVVRLSESNSRKFEMHVPETVSGTMVSALSKLDEAEEWIELSAPNRVTRESFLISLGIANFEGKASELSYETVLFPLSGTVTASGPTTPPSIIRVKDTDKRSVVSSIIGETPRRRRGQQSPTSNLSVDGVSVDDEEETALSPYHTALASPSQDESVNSEELRYLRAKLSAKDRDFDRLQWQLLKSEEKLKSLTNSLTSSKNECSEYRKKMELGERRMVTLESKIKSTKADYEDHIESLERQLTEYNDRCISYEKQTKSMGNEKAVLSAGIESRNSKIESLQYQVSTLTASQNKSTHFEKQCGVLSAKVEALQQLCVQLESVQKELDESKQHTSTLEANLILEREQSLALKKQLEDSQKHCERVQAERNRLKQKSDSLSKEISRICVNGMGLSDVEKVMKNELALRTELQVMRDQKIILQREIEKCQLEVNLMTDAHNSMTVSDRDGIRVAMQKAELERVVSSLTEVLSAKEMQIETLKEINRTLSEEITVLQKGGQHAYV